MSLSNYKITDAEIARNGVVAAPDKLSGSARENKMLFDRLIRESVKTLLNALIDALSGSGGAGEIGTAEIEGVTGGDVQTVLGSLKVLVDAKADGAGTEAALALKSDKAATDLHIKAVSFDAQTGVFTFTREDGSFVTFDTALEKVATNWRYDAASQSLVLTLADGTAQSVPMSAFVTETEFTDSGQIAFSVNDHTVTATVKAGSITDTMLASTLMDWLRSCARDADTCAANAAQSETAAELYRTQAAGSASSAAQSETSAAASRSGADSAAILAESYAHGGTGTREGEDTDNAEYYKKRAKEIVGGDYAPREAFEAHANCDAIHVTAADKAAWNAAAKSRLTANLTLYVDAKSGSDDNAGTSDAPLATINAALSKVPKDLGGHSAVIYLYPGDYPKTTISGFCNGWLTISATSNGNVDTTRFMDGNAIIVQDCQAHIKIQYVSVIDERDVSHPYGIIEIITACHAVELNGVKVKVAKGHAVYASSAFTRVYLTSGTITAGEGYAVACFYGAEIRTYRYAAISGNAIASEAGTIYFDAIPTNCMYIASVGGRIYAGTQTNAPSY